MRATATALLMTLTMSFMLGGCFPHDQRKQTYAKLTEGGMFAAGIALEGFVNTGADCDMNASPSMPAGTCHTKASVLGDIGVALILGGLLGFVATISTAEDEKEPPRVDIKADKPADKPDVKLPGAKTPPVVAPAATTTPPASAGL